jgi:hypothetical protein
VTWASWGYGSPAPLARVPTKLGLMPAVRGYPHNFGWVRTELPYQLWQTSFALRHGLAPRPDMVILCALLRHARLLVLLRRARGVVRLPGHGLGARALPEYRQVSQEGMHDSPGQRRNIRMKEENRKRKRIHAYIRRTRACGLASMPPDTGSLRGNPYTAGEYDSALSISPCHQIWPRANFRDVYGWLS